MGTGESKTTIDKLGAASSKEVWSMDYHLWLSGDSKKLYTHESYKNSDIVLEHINIAGEILNELFTSVEL